MYAEVEEDIAERKRRGLRDSDRHRLKIDMMREYFALLENDAQLKRTSPALLNLLEEVQKVRRVNPLTYRRINYRLLPGDKFEQIN